MNLYISDQHFGHKNVILFDHRPFQDVDEMNEVMISLWNGRVRDEDDVWILGDFCYRSGVSPVSILRRLRGHKHLIIGNHDGEILKNQQARSYFESIDHLLEITDNGQKIVLCHFPICDWHHMNNGAVHVFGHIHNKTHRTAQYMHSIGNAYNAAAAINGYRPCSLRELKENNERFWQQARPEKWYGFDQKV